MAENSFSNLPDSFYRQLLHSLDDGIYFVDRFRRIVFWNQGAEKISGYSFDEVQGRFCGDGLLQHVDFDGNIMCGAGCPLTATIKDGQNHEVDVYLKHKNGHRVPVKVISSPVYNADGDIIGAVERFTDIQGGRHYEITQGIGQATEWARPNSSLALVPSRLTMSPSTGQARMQR